MKDQENGISVILRKICYGKTIMKTWTKAIIAVFITFTLFWGGYAYVKNNLNNTSDLNTEIDLLRINNAKLYREFESARSEVDSLTDTNTDLRDENNQIREKLIRAGQRLVGSIELSSELREDNREAGQIIRESLGIVRKIREAYSRN